MSSQIGRLGRRAGAAMLATTVFGLAFINAHAAWALCPNCVGQAKTLTAKQELLGVFLLVPFVVAWVTVRLIRRHLPRGPS